MKRTLLPALPAVLLLGALLSLRPWGAAGKDAPGEAQWVWFDEGNPLVTAPAEARYFRRAFTINRPVPNPVDEAKLQITADNAFTAYVNGVKVGEGDAWQTLYSFDVKKHLVHGKNVVAVRAKNDGGPAGLLVRLSYAPSGRTAEALVTDKAWKASKAAAKGWEEVEFDDRKWSPVKVLGAYGKVGPWKAAKAGGSLRFTVPDGFKVEPAVKDPGDRGVFSLVNMTFDAKGRLLASEERGPILLCTDPDKDGVLQKVTPYCTLVKNCQGMCWVGDALLLVGDGPKGVGLYRCRDTKGADKIDEATLLHKFKGGMGEHGPHAILHGPDGWLYLVLGNHAWAQVDKLAENSPLRRWPTGDMGPDQGKPGSTEDVLLPRLNDARGHAANILAPGGTVWRLDPKGQNMSLVSAGFRNHYDAAFSPSGELFTFDSDMEWDDALPWYRAVRVCHCTPGSDFVWRTGAANTPNYYLDSLPPAVETGRGSPVGVAFYDHHAYPAKYRGAFFMADWSLGLIYAVHLKRDGASYKATAEKFCAGSPMNVTDLEVGPDGAMYFTMGGRGTRGGVYRIVYTGDKGAAPDVDDQPLSAWTRRLWEESFEGKKGADARAKSAAELTARAKDSKRPAPARVQALTLLHLHKLALDAKVLLELAKDKDAEVRAHAVWLFGVRGDKDGKGALLKALADDDALVRRRACEALVRAGVGPDVDAIWPLLNDDDRFVRTAARLVLQRIEPKKWAGKLAKETKDRVAWEGVVALCKTGQAAAHADKVWARLDQAPPAEAGALLGYVRTAQLALFHAGEARKEIASVAARCDKLFPHKDAAVNRELAIVLTHCKRAKQLDTAVHAKLLAALAATADRAQQIHYFYCLRLLPEGWTAAQKAALVKWYESTRDWKGGHSFTPFLENIFHEALGAYSVADRKTLLTTGEKTPLAAFVLARRLYIDRQPELLPAVKALQARLDVAGAKVHRGPELRRALAEATLRTITEHPKAEYFADLVAGLSSTNKLVVYDSVTALRKIAAKPKAEDPAPYRAALLASRRLDPANRWKAVELLRHWSGGKKFGADDGQWKPELASWAKWYGQTFPKGPALPGDAGDKPTPSKYTFKELQAFLEKDGKAGDVASGKKVFEKASCLKCHKYGKDGEGVGPDLTTLAKRFKRADVLESLVYPSKVISDQYRSTTVVTKKGVSFTGLLADMGETVSILLSDGSKVTVKKAQIESQYASLVSVMPDKLLDELTKKEIADLFAYLESDPEK